MIHVAITRTVRPGHEQELERRLAEMFREAERDPGVQGAYLLRPADEGSREYGIIRTFADPEARDRFYASAFYQRWNETIAPLVEGPPKKREIHGLEGFFVKESAGAPPAWKMAFVTWLAVNPAVFVCTSIVEAVFGPLPMLVDLLVGNVLVVASLTWILMPILTRVFARWLQPRAEQRPGEDEGTVAP